MRWKARRVAVAGLCLAVGGLVVAPLGAQPEGAWVKPLEGITWQEIVPGVDFGAVYGDFSKEAHGKLARFAPGVASPPHVHTHAYWAVVIQGTVTNPFEGEEDPPEMGPGDSWHVRPGWSTSPPACPRSPASSTPTWTTCGTSRSWSGGTRAGRRKSNAVPPAAPD